MQSVRVGYSRTSVVDVVVDGEPLLRTRAYVYTQMRRGDQTVTQTMTLTSWDAAKGGLRKFESRMSAGSGEIVSKGVVRGEQLVMETATLGQTQSQAIPWKSHWGGFFAAELSLRASPLGPGQLRTIRGLAPVLNLPADTQMAAKDYESVELTEDAKAAGRRTEKLLKVTSILDFGLQQIESLLWLNDRGDAVKTLVPSVGQETVRTTKAEALRRSAAGQFDMQQTSIVKLRGTLPGGRQTRRAVYRARVSQGTIDGLFSDCPSQRVKNIDEQTAELTVTAIRPGEPKQIDSPAPPPDDADGQANNFVQSDDEQIVLLAKQAVAAQANSWQAAVALEKLVQQKVKFTPLSPAFATAAEVVRSGEGDCTEHAVLLAALCRARKVPARVAFGLVYYPPEQGFAFHAWNEAWIDDRWVPLDATLGLGGIGADHIKLGDTNLAGASPLADLLSVLQAFGRLQLEVIEAE
jgi:hypothetical protein